MRDPVTLNMAAPAEEIGRLRGRANRRDMQRTLERIREIVEAG